MFRIQVMMGVCVPFAICFLAAVLSGASSTLLIVIACAGTASCLIAGYFLIRVFESSLHEPIAMLKTIQQELGDSSPTESTAETVNESVLHTMVKSITDETRQQLRSLRLQTRTLQQSQTLFEGILGTMVEGVLVLDAEQHILYANAMAKKLLDCETREVHQRPVWEANRSPEFQDALESALVSDDVYQQELTLARSNSVVELTAVRLLLNDESESGLVVVLHNVTELRQVERMRRDFVSDVSHELKTPLTSIQVYADTLLDALDDPENCKLFVQRITEQSERLQSLIQNMLRLSKIESQSEAFELLPMDVGDVMQECLRERSALFVARSVQIQTAPFDGTLRVRADHEGLRTIFTNLISNALNHSPEQGEIEVRWFEQGTDAVIEVEDHGDGIAAEHRERIFERFYRVDKARTRAIGGNGLGLAIVKQFVTVFGGTIEVESEVGKGSLFRVRLPQLEPSQSAQSEQSLHAN